MTYQARVVIAGLGAVVLELLRGAAVSLEAAPLARGLTSISCPNLSLRPLGIDDPGIELHARDQSLQCRTFRVHERRGDASSRPIDLFVVVAPATGAGLKAEPLFFFAGGPGQGAAQMAAYYLNHWDRVRQNHDFVFVDMRGTGNSSPLACPPLPNTDSAEAQLGQLYDVNLLRSCASRLTQMTDLSQYTTAIAVDDVDDVREALGYGLVELEGASYASRAGLEYLRRHGQHVRAAYLAAFAPSFQQIGASFARDLDLALDRLLQECAADRVCNSAYPQLQADLDRLTIRLRQGPVSVSFVNPATSARETIHVTQGLFFSQLRSMLASMEDTARVPFVVTRAGAGDFSQIISDGLARVSSIQRVISWGFYWSVICSEDMPFVDVQRAYDEAVKSRLGIYALKAHTQACAVWPHADVSNDTHKPVSSDVPVLLESGGHDPDTTARWGEMTALFLSRGRHILVQNASHGSVEMGWDDCILPVVAKFLETAAVKMLDVSCEARIDRLPFYLGPRPAGVQAQHPH
jgi:pimeloyl-ACP methyl ester carboxylesterase